MSTRATRTPGGAKHTTRFKTLRGWLNPVFCLSFLIVCKKISNILDKSWEPAVSVTVSMSLSVSMTVSMSLSLSASVTVSLSVIVTVSVDQRSESRLNEAGNVQNLTLSTF